MKTAQLSPLASRLIQVVAVGATALLSSSAAFAGIANTKHNLGSDGTGPNVVNSAATAEICVFCHTPHGANTGAPVPLWNKALPTSTYQMYSALGTSSLDAAELSVGSVSLACLSCHDGTQAMDSMINKPGSGGYSATGASAGYGWASGAATMTNAGGAPFPMLGTDLRNDHPIGIQYCGGPTSGSTVAANITSGLCRDTDFNTAQYKSINTNPVWWVDTGGSGSGTREKTDMMLYTRDFTGSGGTGPSVECASCHDPHVESKATNQVAFLRVSQAGSGVCLACHTK